MSEERKTIRVHIEYGDMKEDIEATDANEVFRIISKFLSQLPSFDIASKLAYSPNIAKIASDLAGIVIMLSEGPVIEQDLPTSKAVGICLAAAHVGKQLDKLQKESLSVEELAKLTRKDEEDVRRRLSDLAGDGLIERVNKEYRITALGLKRITEEVIPLLKGEK